MSFNLKDLDFSIELSSAGTHGSSFPRENCAGIGLLRPDTKLRKYKLKVLIDKDTCKKAGIHPRGFCMARFSACSKAVQILFQAKQGDSFKGYIVRPLGAAKNNKQIEKDLKDEGTKYMPCFIELTVDMDLLNNQKTKAFPIEYVDILHVAKHQIVIDIDKLRIEVK